MNVLLTFLHLKSKGQGNFIKIPSAKYNSGIASGREGFAQKPLTTEIVHSVLETGEHFTHDHNTL